MIQKKNVQQKENIRPEEKKTYNVVDTKKISLGRFSIIKDSVEKTGEIYPYSYISMKDSVSILPFVDKKLLLIKQYRHSLKKWIYEIPGGAVAQGESVLEAAKRELLEETGYQVKRIRGLEFYYPSPGASTEKAYLYVAWCGNRPRAIGARTIGTTDKRSCINVAIKIQDENFKVAVVRPPMVYGKGCKGNYPRLRLLALRLPFFSKDKKSEIYDFY